jgi:hypothetical protein
MNNVWGFQFLCIFTTTSYYGYHNGCEVISHYSLICISLMNKDIEHLFVLLLAICVCSLEKCLFKCPFKKWSYLGFFVCFCCCWLVNNSLHILNVSFQLGVWFASIFLVVLVGMSMFSWLCFNFHGNIACNTKVFNFCVVQLMSFFFKHLYIWCHV